MPITASLPIVADRHFACVRTLRFHGIDLTGAGLAAEVRLAADTPGVPLARLDRITAAGQGLRLTDVAMEDGVPVSTVLMRINKSVMEAMPGAGAPAFLAWDLSIQLAGVADGEAQRRAAGEFMVLPGVVGADNASPTGALAGRPLVASWSTADLTFGDQTVDIRLSGTDLLAPLVTRATIASEDAQAAAQDALATRNSFPNYFRGDKGDPGGTLDAIGAYTQVKATPIAVMPGVNVIYVSGYSAFGDAGMRAAFVEMETGAVVEVGRPNFQVVDGRTFALALKGQILRPGMFGAKGDLKPDMSNLDSATDDTAALNDFFGFLSIYDAGVADWTTRSKVTGTVYLGNPTGTAVMATRMVLGKMVLCSPPGVEINRLVHQRYNVHFTLGKVDLYCGGYRSIAAYADRSVNVGWFHEESNRGRFAGGIIWNCRYSGLYLQDGHSFTELGEWQIWNCGSGAKATNPTNTMQTTITARTDTGSGSSAGQRSVVSLSTMPPEFLDQYLLDYTVPSGNYRFLGAAVVFLRSGPGRWHHVESIDRAAGTVSVFPWLPTEADVGATLPLVFGAGIIGNGNDGNNATIERIDIRRCAVGMQLANSGWHIKRGQIVQTLIGFQNSGYRGGAAYSNRFEGYFEKDGLETPVLFLTPVSAVSNFSVESELNVQPELFRELIAVPNPATPANEPFQNLRFMKDGVMREWEVTSYAPSVYPFFGDKRNYLLPIHSTSSSVKVGIQPLDQALNKTLGYTGGLLLVTGTGSAGQFMGPVTITPPSGGTINGLASLVLSGFSGPALIKLYRDFSVPEPKWLAMVIAGLPAVSTSRAGSVTIPAGANEKAVVFPTPRSDSLYTVVASARGAELAWPKDGSLTASGFTLVRANTTGALPVNWILSASANP